MNYLKLQTLVNKLAGVEIINDRPNWIPLTVNGSYEFDTRKVYISLNSLWFGDTKLPEIYRWTVLFHELAHWTGNFDNLCRPVVCGDLVCKAEFCAEEILAETVASRAMEYLGLQTAESRAISERYVKAYRVMPIDESSLQTDIDRAFKFLKKLVLDPLKGVIQNETDENYHTITFGPLQPSCETELQNRKSESGNQKQKPNPETDGAFAEKWSKAGKGKKAGADYFKKFYGEPSFSKTAIRRVKNRIRV